MAVPQALRNQYACIETGKRPEPMPKCMRCPATLLRRNARMCGPCSAARYTERQEQQRARAKKLAPPPVRATILRDSIDALGHAARRAGLTVAEIEAMGPKLSPEDERLMSHG